jgi:hypothetical protein
VRLEVHQSCPRHPESDDNSHLPAMLAEHCWYQTAFPPPWRFRLQSHGDTTLHTTACEPADICNPVSPCLQSVASPHRTKHALRAHLPLMEKRTHWFPAPLMVPPDTQCGLSLPNNTVWPNTRVPCQKHPVDDTFFDDTVLAKRCYTRSPLPAPNEACTACAPSAGGEVDPLAPHTCGDAPRTSKQSTSTTHVWPNTEG